MLESLVGLEGDVLFLLNWAAGPEPLGTVIGHQRVLLGFPRPAARWTATWSVTARPGFITRRVPMPIGEPDGRVTPRLERIVRALRADGINAKAEPQMDAWLPTDAAFVVPLGQAVLAAGRPRALADDPDAVRSMIRLMRQNLGALPTRPVPRGFVALQTLPEGLLAPSAAALLAKPDGRPQRARQRHARHGGGRTRAAGRADARPCEGLVGDGQVAFCPGAIGVSIRERGRRRAGQPGLARDRGDDGSHDPADGGGVGLGPVDVGEQQVGGADQGRGQRADVGVGGDAAEFPLGREVAADQDGGLGQEGDARSGGGAQPGAQLVTCDDQADKRQIAGVNRSGRAAARLPATVPVPAVARRAAAWSAIRRSCRVRGRRGTRRNRRSGGAALLWLPPPRR